MVISQFLNIHIYIYIYIYGAIILVQDMSQHDTAYMYFSFIGSILNFNTCGGCLLSLDSMFIVF